MGNSFHSPIWEVSMDQVLELKNIHYTYHTLDGETPALTDISFSLNKGEFVAIVGPSGCGNAMCEQRKQFRRQPLIFFRFLMINGCHR